MPEKHRQMGQWTPERFIRWAQNIGPNTAALITTVLRSRRHPQQAYRSCLDVLRLANTCGDERLEAAAGRAMAQACSRAGRRQEEADPQSSEAAGCPAPVSSNSYVRDRSASAFISRRLSRFRLSNPVPVLMFHRSAVRSTSLTTEWSNARDPRPW